MARSFSIVGFPPNYDEKTKNLNLKEIGRTDKKEYFYDDGYCFKIYQDQKTKMIYEEFEAGCPWDGGPCLYLGLREKESQKVVSSWTQSQMGFCDDDVKLPEGIDESLFKGFITQYDLENLKGYCPLYCQIFKDRIELYQDVDGTSNPDRIYLCVETTEGETVRDWLSQQNFKIEEFVKTSLQDLRKAYKQIHEEYFPKN